MDATNLIRPRDAATMLGISYPTLKQWIYKGKIGTIKTAGGHHRIPEAELDKFLTRKPKRRKAEQGSAGVRRISGRNQLVGRVTAIKVDGLLAQVSIEIGDQQISSVITSDSVREMRLKPGDRVAALIKSTAVMVSRV
jgi:molybdopterin-binding protein